MIRWHWSRQSNLRTAFERLAREHGPALYGSALRMARNPDDANDLAQDALVRGYIAFDRFEPGTNFKAWMLRILTNVYITDYRRRKRVGFVGFDDLSTNGQEPFDIVDPKPGPESELLSGAMDSEIEAALGMLSDDVRLTVLLVDVEDLPYEEAADLLGVPVGTVRSRLNRGRGIMRRQLAEYARDRFIAVGVVKGAP